MKESIKHINTNPGKILFNMPFFISATAFGCLVYFSVNNFPALIAYEAVALALTMFAKLDLSVVKSKCSQYKVIGAVLVSLWTGYTFYYTIRQAGEGSIWHTLAGSAGMSLDGAVMILAAIAGAVSVYSVLVIFCFADEKLDIKAEFAALKQNLSQKTNVLQSFAVIFGVYLLSIISLIRADILYVDDITRKVNGIPGWDNYSRYLSNVLSKLINTNFYLADISPLLQLMAIALAAAASVIVIAVFTKGDRISFRSVVAVLPLGMSPYMMGCYSYKYDAAYMALTLLAAVFPLLFRGRKTAVYFTAVTASMLVTGLTYQAAYGIFPVMVVLLCFMEWQSGEKLENVAEFAFKSAAAYITGVLSFRVFFMKPVSNGYVSSELLSLGEMPVGVVKNINRYLSMVVSDFDIKWLVCVAVVFVAFVAVSAANSRQNKVLTAFAGVAVLAVCASLSFGLYIAFKYPLGEARAMYGFGAFIGAVAVMAVQNKSAKLPQLAALYLSWCFLVFGFTFGNALGEQYRYSRFRMETLLADLNSVEAFAYGEEINMQIKGGVGDSPAVANMPQNRKVMGRLIYTVFDATWSEGTDYFYNMYGLENVNRVEDLEEENLELLIDGYYHSVYGDSENVLVVLK